MPQYHSQGKFPHKRHTVYRKSDGNLYAEELVSSEGFANVYSLIYHCYPPTMIKHVGASYSVEPKVVSQRHLNHESFIGFNIAPEADYLQSRKHILVNNDLNICLAAPQQSLKDYFYKNADSDEVIFVHIGSGTLKTIYGNLDFGYGDYLVIPRGTIYQIEFKDADNRLVIVESHSPIITPKRYRNEYGQLLEHSPYCERDIRKPMNMETHDEKGDFKVMIKKQGMMYPFTYGTHPFDAIGWDGNLYPWAFSIHDFEPITGRVHQPPPVHQTFEAHNYVVCSFCPRLYDYHPDSIPAPYNHSNIDSDEVLYYVAGDFMSRNDVKLGNLTLHPKGIPHGPAPGAMERSIGKTETKELAVMVDTFHPLMVTDDSLKIKTDDYYLSWLDDK